MRMNQGGPEVEDDEKGMNFHERSFPSDYDVEFADADALNKLFVGGLSWETTQDSLQRYFSRYGEVIDCVVMKNNETGRSRGFGFVTFADPTNVQIVLNNGPHNLDGRTIDPKQCNPRTLQKPKIRGGCYPKVFLGGLPSNVTETDLRMFFGRYGKVMEVVIMYDQEKKKSRGFGFLSFEDDASVDRVTSEHYVNLNGKQVEIKKAEPRDGSANHKMPGQEPGQSASSHWGPPGPTALGMMQGPNGQMNAGPPMNMAAAMAAPNAMMQGYQGWGTSPQQQNSQWYGTPNPNSGYQGWGAPPPQPQGPPPQWGGYNTTAQQTQGYGSYDMYNSTTAGPTPNSGGGGNWNSWGLQTNSGSATSNDLYNRAPSGPGASSGGPPGMPSGPNTNNSKAPSDYSAYGAGYGNYTNDQSSSYPRSYTNDIVSQPYQPQQQDDFLKQY